MTRDDIIRMAQEAGFGNYAYEARTMFERFFHMAQAAEREACHALRQTLPNPHKDCQVSSHAYDMAIIAYGAAIRAREQA